MKNEVLFPEIAFIVRTLLMLEYLMQDAYEAKKQKLADAGQPEG